MLFWLVQVSAILFNLLAHIYLTKYKYDKVARAALNGKVMIGTKDSVKNRIGARMNTSCQNR